MKTLLLTGETINWSEIDGEKISVPVLSEGCLKCELKSKRVIVPPENLGKEIVLVAQAPGEEEEKSNPPRPLIGPSGKILFRVLESVGLRREDFWITNVVKCRVGPKPDGVGDIEPNSKIRSCCFEQWRELEWENLTGRLVVLMGSMATKTFLNENMSKVRGKVIEKDGICFYPIWHPAYVARNNELLYIWKKDISLIPKLVKKSRGIMRQEFFFDLVREPSMITDYEYLLREPEICIDFETSTLSPKSQDAKIICCAIADSSGRVIVLDIENLGHSGLEFLKRIMESDSPKIFQNAKFEIAWAREKLGVRIRNIVFDPMLAQFLLDEGLGSSVGLKQMVWRYFPEYGGYAEGVEVSNIASVEKEKLFRYNALDAFLTQKIARKLKEEIKNKGLDFLLKDIMIPASYGVAEMELSGIKVDIEKGKSLAGEIERKIQKLLNEISNDPVIRGIEGFNPDSPHSLRTLFFEKLGFSPKRKTRTSLGSVEKDFLESIANSCEIARKIVEYKSLRKLGSTYLENFIKMSDSDGFLRPEYNMTASKGGRIYAAKPNIQNVPHDLRKLFVSRFPGGKLLSMDFKQIELRVVTMIANDSWMKKIFKMNGDPHSLIASELYGVRPETLNKDSVERKRAKSVTFGMIYGMRAETLAERENIPIGEAKKIYNEFFRRASGIRKWQENQRKLATNGRLISSPFNRQWDLSVYQGEERAKRAFNFPIQSTASDINLMTMGLIAELKDELGLKARMIASIHDEIVFDVPPDEVSVLSDLIRNVVKSLTDFVPWMDIPMEAEIKVSDSWE